MAKKRKEKEGLVDMLSKPWVAVTSVISGVMFIGGGGWAVAEYMGTYAKKDEVQMVAEKITQKVEVVQVQVQSVYDVRIEQLTIQRDRLIRKPNKSQQDLQDLRDIEKELELARKMRQIK